MSEYLYGAEIHETSEYVALKFPYEDKMYALTIGLDMFEQLAVVPGQKSPVLMEALVYDVNDDAEYYTEGFE